MKQNGFDELQKKLTKLADNAKKLDGANQVPLKDLLSDAFIKRHSAFSDVDELFKTSGFAVESQEDFAAIPDTEWDQFIEKSTSFSSWNDMLGAAIKEWTKKQLGL
ncbi:hypothetical protein DBR37_06460 [Herminiimonas sp. KBW02]|uniref:hypothetical protein n=1 Tax=Herminiimonas sp. KBW02 TaxID=2153363 RepID=UPI000F5983A5|nr:hypothetical protein [Herminiimonas sp. KBW02]RQO35986.1 hypothetical protein DBR37_06460 [Herminiimonas sp. KBW02]